MNILMHLCCGPCTLFPLTRLREDGFSVSGFFFNPNIHPYGEFQKRLEALDTLCEKMDLAVDQVRDYGLREYLREVVFHEDLRCPICYRMRLVATVRHALAIGADAFSTTLLYSRYQQHEIIRQLGEELAEEFKIPFYYEDFRKGWQQGIDMSVEMGLYRQPYCGCIYSEQERYDKKFRKKKRKEKKASAS